MRSFWRSNTKSLSYDANIVAEAGAMPQQHFVNDFLRVESLVLAVSCDAETIYHLQAVVAISDKLLNQLVVFTSFLDGSDCAVKALVVQVDWVGLEARPTLGTLRFGRIVCRLNTHQLLNKSLLLLNFIVGVDDKILHLLATEVVRNVSVELSTEIFK